MSDPLREQEETEAAKMLIELAFLVPRGTDARQHSAFRQLVHYIGAVKARAESRSCPSPGWICSCGSRAMRQDGGPHCENCGEVVTYRGPWVAP